MIRFAAVLACFWATAAVAQPEVIFAGPLPGLETAELTSAFSVGQDDIIILGTRTNAYDVGSGALVLEQDLSALSSVLVGRGPRLLLVAGEEFGVAEGRQFRPLVRLPVAGMSLARGGQSEALVYGGPPSDTANQARLGEQLAGLRESLGPDHNVVRELEATIANLDAANSVFRLTGGGAAKLVTANGPVTALAGSPGQVALATGNAVYRYRYSGELSLLFALTPGAEITSLAIEPATEALYLTVGGDILRHDGGDLVRVAEGAGSKIVIANGWLYAFAPERPRLIRFPLGE